MTGAPAGYYCDACGYEWTTWPTDPGPCGAHVGGIPCPRPDAFRDYQRRHGRPEHAHDRTTGRPPGTGL